MSEFNLNSWLMASHLFKALAVSSTKNGKYAVKKIDEKEGFYFFYKEANLKIKVPMGAVFETNAKINGILGIKFISSTNCPSQALGLCQLGKEKMCYGKQGENQSRPKHNINGLKGMGGELNGELCAYFWDRFTQSVRIRVRFFHYCEYYSIETLRFNLKGDFRTAQDVAIIYHLAKSGLFDCLTGYTARDDLYLHIRALIEDCPNVRINGSNILYNNRFFVTPYISDMVKAFHSCKGACANCRNCYKLNGKVIYCLLHGSGSDTELNNPINRDYLENWSKKALPWDILEGIDWTVNKGLLTCINKHLQKLGVILRFKTHRDLIRFIKKTGGL